MEEVLEGGKFASGNIAKIMYLRLGDGLGHATLHPGLDEPKADARTGSFADFARSFASLTHSLTCSWESVSRGHPKEYLMVF